MEGFANKDLLEVMTRARLFVWVNEIEQTATDKFVFLLADVRRQDWVKILKA